MESDPRPAAARTVLTSSQDIIGDIVLGQSFKLMEKMSESDYDDDVTQWIHGIAKWLFVVGI